MTHNPYHNYLKEVEKIDRNLDATWRNRLRTELKRSLAPRPWKSTMSQGRVRAWFDRKLDGIMAYTLADKRDWPQQTVDILYDRFTEGRNINWLSVKYRISERQVYKRIRWALDRVIDTAPEAVIRALLAPDSRWIIKGCLHCGGDLIWNSEGAYIELEGDYCCFQCSRRHRYDNKGSLYLIVQVVQNNLTNHALVDILNSTVGEV